MSVCLSDGIIAVDAVAALESRFVKNHLLLRANASPDLKSHFVFCNQGNVFDAVMCVFDFYAKPVCTVFKIA